MITTPKLPPKKGYVEVEEDGKRVYRPTTETVEKLRREAVLEAENTLLKAQVQALSDRNEFVEDCMAEMAMQVYA